MGPIVSLNFCSVCPNTVEVESEAEKRVTSTKKKGSRNMGVLKLAWLLEGKIAAKLHREKGHRKLSDRGGPAFAVIFGPEF